ncbi:STAS domain-containing protein [Amycolatopsis anabasis]|uniref:STAS domain-containing protein n=1 Tax=Amycolatopsis anabasis TaxID=1840409 RepID=UPI00131D09D2|nr:STAS domain-containing protein [Amycolatopsis anabasis]
MENSNQAMPPDTLTVKVAALEPGRVLVAALGEIDLATNLEWQERLSGALDPPPPAVLVADLTKVSFLGSHGLNSLVRVQEKAEETGTDFRVVGSHRAVLRPIELTGLSGHLHLFDSLDAALAAQHHPRVQRP